MKCPLCNATEFIGELSVIDRQGVLGSADDLELRFSLEERSVKSGESVSVLPSAAVCRSCGFVAMVVEGAQLSFLEDAAEVKRAMGDAGKLGDAPDYREYLGEEPGRRHLSFYERIRGFANWLRGRSGSFPVG